MTIEPTEADKAAAAAFEKQFFEQRGCVDKDTLALIIAQHMAPERQAAAALREENERLRVALHDAIRRPMGVVPDSAAEFYGDDRR